MSGFHRIYYAKGGTAVYSDPVQSFPLLLKSLYIFPGTVPYRIVHDQAHPFEVLWFHIDALAGRSVEVRQYSIDEDSFEDHLLQALSRSLGKSHAMTEKLLEALLDSIGFAPAIPPEIAWILDYIDANQGNACSNRKIAELLGYNEKYLVRLFSQTFGMKPHQYVMNVRMSTAAKSMLSGRSIKETADALAYSSPGNFNRDFRKHYHVTPKQFVTSYHKGP